MKVNRLSGDAARQLLLHLISSGEVTDDQLTNILHKSPTAEVCRVTDRFHLLLCRYHVRSSGQQCGYYEEDKMENCWQLPCHQQWLNDTLKMMEDFEITTEAEFNGLFMKANAVQTSILTLKEEQPNAYRILALMNGWEEPK